MIPALIGVPWLEEAKILFFYYDSSVCKWHISIALDCIMLCLILNIAELLLHLIKNIMQWILGWVQDSIYNNFWHDRNYSFAIGTIYSYKVIFSVLVIIKLK